MAYIREGEYSLKEVYDFLDSDAKLFKGKQVNKKSLRYKVFKKNHKCVSCGAVGTFYALEKFSHSKLEIYHFNLRAVRNGREILMTKDHIIPSSKGGDDSLSNLQTMCQRCNSIKGNSIEGEYEIPPESEEIISNDFEITNEQIMQLMAILRDTINFDNSTKTFGSLNHSKRVELYKAISKQYFKVGKRSVRNFMDKLIRGFLKSPENKVVQEK